MTSTIRSKQIPQSRDYSLRKPREWDKLPSRIHSDNLLTPKLTSGYYWPNRFKGKVQRDLQTRVFSEQVLPKSLRSKFKFEEIIMISGVVHDTRNHIQRSVNTPHINSALLITGSCYYHLFLVLLIQESCYSPHHLLRKVSNSTCHLQQGLEIFAVEKC